MAKRTDGGKDRLLDQLEKLLRRMNDIFNLPHFVWKKRGAFIIDDDAGDADIDVLTSTGATTPPEWRACPYDLAFCFLDAYEASQWIGHIVQVRSVLLPASLTGSYAVARAASTGSRTFTIYRRTAAGVATSIGTVLFNASATGVFTFASDITLAAGDTLALQAPGTVDATLLDIAITFKGTRA